MKLTPRQLTFLNKLVELYGQTQEPVHYSVIATALGVNKFSAYDMLCLLTEKGLARSAYVLSSDNPGPGRSLIVFAPTGQGISNSTPPKPDLGNQEDWLANRQDMLEMLHRTEENTSWDELRVILAHLPDTRSRLIYCAHMITALLMNLSKANLQASVPKANLLQSINALIASGEIGLSTLGGFSLGASLNQRIDSSLLDDLFAHTKRYQSCLLTLSEDSRAILTEFLREALIILQQQHAV